MASALQLNVLGRFQIRAENEPVGPIATKAQAILAYLAVENNRANTRERASLTGLGYNHGRWLVPSS